MDCNFEIGRKTIPTGNTDLYYCTCASVWFNGFDGMPLWGYHEELEQDISAQMCGIERRAKYYFAYKVLGR